MTGWERLHRFSVAHSTCSGDVNYIDPTEADVVEADELMVWIEMRCDGCAASARELVSLKEMFTGFGQLLRDARIAPEAVIEAARRGDQRTLDAIGEQLKMSPAMLREALRSMRKAQSGESRN